MARRSECSVTHGERSPRRPAKSPSRDRRLHDAPGKVASALNQLRSLNGMLAQAPRQLDSAGVPASFRRRVDSPAPDGTLDAPEANDRLRGENACVTICESFHTPKRTLTSTPSTPASASGRLASTHGKVRSSSCQVDSTAFQVDYAGGRLRSPNRQLLHAFGMLRQSNVWMQCRELHARFADCER
jgi:hypothetical protein